jgi:lipoprotein-anchoring transpeptidase ErfK/SrfK
VLPGTAQDVAHLGEKWRYSVQRLVLLCLVAITSAFPCAAAPAKISAEAINSADLSGGGAEKNRALIAKAEILLDRRHFSPGEIDGSNGENFRKALTAFQRIEDLKPTGKLDNDTWAHLTKEDNASAIVEYTINEKDVRGPFVRKLPRKMEEQADLDALSYTSPLELLGERFHMSQSLLKALNPNKPFDKAGTVIAVANVGGTPSDDSRKATKIESDKQSRELRALGGDGTLLAFYPASVGSEEKPAPSGTLKVTKISKDPTYTYNPKYHFKGVHAATKFTIKPGPNNPVGVVWIALTGEGYGIHGTPDPDKVGKTASHGCIRLTNWDAMDLSTKLEKGTPVTFLDE